MKSIAIIGAGGHARGLHGQAYKQLLETHPGRFRIAGVCDLDRRRARSMAEMLNCDAIWSDYRAMVDELRPDAVVAVTPIDLTCRIVTDLCSFGIPLVVEKPPGASYAEALELKAALEQAGVPHMVSFNRRFTPPGLWFQRRRPELAGFEPTLLIGRMTRVARLERDFVFGTGIHMIDAARGLLGDPAGRVLAAWKTDAGDGILAGAEVDFEGVRAIFVFGPNAGEMSESIDLIGADRSVHLDYQHGRGRIETSGETEAAFELEPDAPRHVRDGNLNEAEAFLDSLDGTSPWRPEIASVVESVRLAEEIDAA